MGKNTRYDKLRRKLNREFARGKTFTPAIAANSTELIFDLNDYEVRDADGFLENGPFNLVTVRNLSGEQITAYPTGDRSTLVKIPANANKAVPVAEEIPGRYVRYLSVQNESANAIPEGEVLIQVGKEIDSTELDLIKMSGLLDLNEQ